MPSKNYNRHRVLDLAARIAAADGQGQQAESRDGGGHQDGHEALGSAAHDGFRPPDHDSPARTDIMG